MFIQRWIDIFFDILFPVVSLVQLWVLILVINFFFSIQSITLILNLVVLAATRCYTYRGIVADAVKASPGVWTLVRHACELVLALRCLRVQVVFSKFRLVAHCRYNVTSSG